MLRREGLAFTVFAALLLVAQLVLAGGMQTAMAAERSNLSALGVLCHLDEAGANRLTETSGNAGLKQSCPCTAGICVPAMAVPAAADAAGPSAGIEPRREPGAVEAGSSIDRRPLTLFARAGRSPPRLPDRSTAL